MKIASNVVFIIIAKTRKNTKPIPSQPKIIANDSMEMSQMIDLNSFFPSKDIYSPRETFLEKVRRLMGVNINKDLQANLYARIRIEEHLKDILKTKEDIGYIFNS